MFQISVSSALIPFPSNLKSTQTTFYNSSKIHSLELSLERPSIKHHYITPVLKSLHWIKILERIHFIAKPTTNNNIPAKVLLRKLHHLTIPLYLISYHLISLPTVRLKVSNRAISHNAPRLSIKSNSVFFSVHPAISSLIYCHLLQASLLITSQVFIQSWSLISSRTSILSHSFRAALSKLESTIIITRFYLLFYEHAC